MADDPLMTRQETADYLRKPKKTLDEWALKGSGPAYSRLGRGTVYRKSDVDRWVRDHLVEAKPAA